MSSTASRTGAGFVYLRLINKDGTISSELGTSQTTNLTTTATNRTLPAITLTAVNITGGQRLCVEVGWTYLTGTDVTTTGTIGIRSARASTDLGVNNTETTANNPWVEFSQTLKFQTQSNAF